MKYFSVLLFLLLSPAFVFSQKEKRKKPKELYPAWFASGHFAFLSSHVAVQKDATWNQLYQDVLFYQSGSGRAGGVAAGYGFNKNLDAWLGIGFGRQDIVQTSNFPILSIEPSDYGASEQLGAHRFVTVKAVEVPAGVRYKVFIGKAFSVYPALGLHLVFTTQKSQAVEVYLDNGAVGTHPDNDFELDNDRPVNLAIQAALGFRLQMARPLFLKVEPFYAWHLAGEQLLTDYSKTSLRSFGIRAGLEYAFRFRPL